MPIFEKKNDWEIFEIGGESLIDFELYLFQKSQNASGLFDGTNSQVKKNRGEKKDTL